MIVLIASSGIYRGDSIATSTRCMRRAVRPNAIIAAPNAIAAGATLGANSDGCIYQAAGCVVQRCRIDLHLLPIANTPTADRVISPCRFDLPVVPGAFAPGAEGNCRRSRSRIRAVLIGYIRGHDRKYQRCRSDMRAMSVGFTSNTDWIYQRPGSGIPVVAVEYPSGPYRTNTWSRPRATQVPDACARRARAVRRCSRSRGPSLRGTFGPTARRVHT